MKTGPVILALVGVALLAFLYFSPVTPSQPEAEITEEIQHSHDASHNPDEEVEEALRQMESGEVPPMEAILKIREVAENHPGNVKANFTLGALSIQTGQYDKAIERFNTVIEQEPENGHAWKLLAEAQLKTGDTVNAQVNFDKALQLVDDETRAAFEKELPQLSIN